VTEKEKHRQPKMKHHLVLSLICKPNVLISSETLHCNVHLWTTIFNTNNG
jgi:hypothetical protein